MPQDLGGVLGGSLSHLRLCGISQGHVQVLKLVLVNRIDITLVLLVSQEVLGFSFGASRYQIQGHGAII